MVQRLSWLPGYPLSHLRQLRKYYSKLGIITNIALQIMTDEEWRNLPIIKGKSFSRYEVSSLGQIRNKKTGVVISSFFILLLVITEICINSRFPRGSFF